jgi:surfeit locus 1 family protein
MRRVVVFIAAVLACALTARLGVWQLDRAAQKLALQARMEAQSRLPPLSNAELGNPDALQRRVLLRGRWLPEQTVWLDNRPMSGRVGFFVVTPLVLDGTGQTILVQRGWLPRNQRERAALPPLITSGGEVEVQGRLAAAPSRLFEFSPSRSGLIRQNLDPVAYAQEIHRALLPFTVWQTGQGGPAEPGLLRDWPAPELGLQTHYGYAFQWFALCALILGLYVWFQLVKPRRNPQRQLAP